MGCGPWVTRFRSGGHSRNGRKGRRFQASSSPSGRPPQGRRKRSDYPIYSGCFDLPPPRGRPAPTEGSFRRDDSEVFHQPTSNLEVGRAVVRLVQDVEVLSCKPDAAERVGTPRERDATNEIRAPEAALAVDAMLASNETSRASAVRAIRASNTTNAKVAAGQPFRVTAERAALACTACDALDRSHVSGVVFPNREKLAKSRVERSCGWDPARIGSRAHDRRERRSSAASVRVAGSSACSSNRRRR